MKAIPQRGGGEAGHTGATLASETMTDTDPWESLPPEIVIPSDTSEAMRIQQTMLEMLEAREFGERDIFSIKLAVEEAMVNAMKHGNQLDRNKKVRIAYHIHNETFYIRIADEGKGFDPDDVPDPTQIENLERPCGRGLLLMRHYMCEVHYRDRGTVVVMAKRRNGKAS